MHCAAAEIRSSGVLRGIGEKAEDVLFSGGGDEVGEYC